MSAIRTIPSSLALGCVSALAFAGGAQAQQAEPQRLGSATVTSTAIDDEDAVKVEEAESPKYTQPLLDIPQTITVLSNTTIRQQNLLTLREALTTIPGITFGAGEGGGGYGDSINLRGQSANNDLQIDGVRDSAQYNRSDTFNLEQIEVVNGANSVFAGSGSIGGTINLITKRPRADDLTIVSGGIGTADYYRGTIDSNVRVAENIAVRLNAMVHHNEFADRDFESSERWGVAPSVTFGIDGPTSVTLLYQHQEDENTPVYGVPYYPALGGLLPGADYGGYYGYKDIDRQDQKIDLATAIVEHQFSDTLSVRNLFRLSHIDADILVNPPQGAFCLASGTLTSGARCDAGQVPGTFYPSGPRGTTRFTETELLYNQLDLMAQFDTGGVQHNLTFGAAYTTEDYRLDSGNSLRNPGGALPNPVLPPISIADPDAVYGGPVNFIRNSRQRGTTSNIAVYLFDAVVLSEQFEINGGVRWEHNDATFRADAVSTAGAITPGVVQETEDDLFSYRIGAVFKPVPNASLYAAYGNSRTPTSSSVRGGCGTATVENVLAGTEPCGVNPQEAVNYEIGGKVDLFDAGLQLTAALFRNERTNYPLASNDPSIGNLQVNDGRNRVDGVALGAAGRITPEWTIFANYTYLDSEVLQSTSNYCLANPGSSYISPNPTNPPTRVTCPLTDTQADNPLTNTPEHSGSLFTTYTLPFGLQVGYGFTYQGSFLLTNTATPFVKAEDWMTHRFYVAYTMDNGLAAQLNVQNVFEERYFTGIRNNGWATPGEGRSAVLTVSYSY
ncbi:TonB-dependent receptor [Croceibacterium mercuriale]|uniref:TonB-dependent receptor n=1 Tax=Croceibacterium mercuriale TaxID=1572751 RepID=A0A0B2BW87_9SPHN|nr:TonB-dependent receptor [Croceibacterium mercuriale]KHL25684.1 TonB-dependent receptor [Croceibacterium mercuriale]